MDESIINRPYLRQLALGLSMIPERRNIMTTTYDQALMKMENENTVLICNAKFVLLKSGNTFSLVKIDENGRKKEYPTVNNSLLLEDDGIDGLEKVEYKRFTYDNLANLQFRIWLSSH